MTLTQQFIDTAPTPTAAARDFALALHADGPNFQRGYPMESAYIVTVEAFRRDGHDFNEIALGEALGFTPERAGELLTMVREEAM